MQITVVKVKKKKKKHLTEVWKILSFLKQRIMAKPRHTHTFFTPQLPQMRNSVKELSSVRGRVQKAY